MGIEGTGLGIPKAANDNHPKKEAVDSRHENVPKQRFTSLITDFTKENGSFLKEYSRDSILQKVVTKVMLYEPNSEPNESELYRHVEALFDECMSPNYSNAIAQKTLSLIREELALFKEPDVSNVTRLSDRTVDLRED